MTFCKFANAGELMTYHNMSLQKKAYYMAQKIKKCSLPFDTENEFRYIVLGEYFDLTADVIEQSFKDVVKAVPDVADSIRNALDNNRFYETLRAYIFQKDKPKTIDLKPYQKSFNILHQMNKDLKAKFDALLDREKAKKEKAREMDFFMRILDLPTVDKDEDLEEEGFPEIFLD